MNPGMMNDRVVFKKPCINETSYSSSEHMYKTAFCTWAYIAHGSGNRSIQSDRITNSYTVKIMIRYYHTVTADMIIECNGIEYRILDIDKNRSLNCINITAEVINE